MFKAHIFVILHPESWNQWCFPFESLPSTIRAASLLLFIVGMCYRSFCFRAFLPPPLHWRVRFTRWYIHKIGFIFIYWVLTHSGSHPSWGSRTSLKPSSFKLILNTFATSRSMSSNGFGFPVRHKPCRGPQTLRYKYKHFPSRHSKSWAMSHEPFLASLLAVSTISSLGPLVPLDCFYDTWRTSYFAPVFKVGVLEALSYLM